MSRLPIFFLLFLIPSSTASTFNFTYPSFPPNTSGVDLFGNASLYMGDIELTTNTVDSDRKDSHGRAIYNNPIRLYDKASGFVAGFTTYFTFIINGLNASNRWNNGDGLAFFLAPVGSTLPINSSGGWLGLFNQTTNGSPSNQIVAVELDTYKNSYDPNGNHMGIDVNSLNSTNYTDWEWDNAGKLNGYARVWYNSTTRTLFASLTYWNGSKESNLSLPINLTTVLPEQVIVGFSAATGDATEVHKILSWNFTSTLPDPVPAPIQDHLSAGADSKRLVVLVTCLAAILLGALATTLVVIRLRKNKKEEEEEGGVEDDGVDVTMDFATGPRRFRYRELAEATNDFREEGKLGQGGFGGVYRGVLGDTGEAVAVKRFSRDRSSQGKKEYVSEVTVISRLRHRNLVRLIGWCHERGEFLLVYDYMEGGSLDSHLFGPKAGLVMSWAHRMTVALGLASAVQYLHEEWEQCVVHRDIKPSNVMIDSDFNARLGDFGLARLVDHGHNPQTTVVAGTMGYLAPECVITGKASRESDVYSFGIVLLEIVCGRRPIGEQQARLVEWVWGLFGAGALVEAVDERLGSEFDQNEAECMMVVGLWCTHPDPVSRPIMRETIRMLSFQSELPRLPPKMPVPVFCAPASMEFGFDSGFAPSSSGGTTTTTTRTTESSSTSLLQSYSKEVAGPRGENGA